MQPKKALMIAGGILLLFCIYLLTRKSSTQDLPVPHPSQNIQIRHTVQKRDLDSYIRAEGVIRHSQTFSVFSEVPGKLIENRLSSGKKVKKDELLLVLENEDLKNELDLSIKDLEESKASFEEFKNFSSPQKVRESAIEFKNLEKEKSEKEKLLTDSEESFKMGMLSKTDLEKIRHDHMIFNETFVIKQSARDKLSEQLKLEENKRLYEIEEKTKKTERLKKDSEKLTILSPCDGIVTKISEILPAEYRQNNLTLIPKDQLLFSVANEKGRLLETKLFEKDTAFLKKGDKAYLVSDFTSANIEGTVSEILSPADQDIFSRLIVTVKVEGYDDFLKPGSPVNIKFVRTRKKQVVVVPMELIFYEDGKPFCLVEKKGTSVRQPLSTGMDDGDYVEVTEGIAEGDVLLNPDTQAS